jgi:hypothetical protein
MIVRNGVATVVVADWYGSMDDGTPFHGSIVRGLDATDPANIKVLGEAKLGGWVRDTRIVGDVLYAVSEEYDWSHGCYAGGDTVASGGAASGYGGNRAVDSTTGYGSSRSGALLPRPHRSKPSVGSKINVPGLLVGASENDPSIIFTMDYRWDGDSSFNEFDVLKLSGDKAYLQSSIILPGYAGSTFVRGDQAYLSVQRVTDPEKYTTVVELHQIDVSNPRRPVDLASKGEDGWGWLLGVEGDRALVTSGWGNAGLDIYRLAQGSAPTYDRFVRMLGWGTSSVARQGDTLYLSSGYWGVQTVDLR